MKPKSMNDDTVISLWHSVGSFELAYFESSDASSYLAVNAKHSALKSL